MEIKKKFLLIKILLLKIYLINKITNWIKDSSKNGKITLTIRLDVYIK